MMPLKIIFVLSALTFITCLEARAEGEEAVVDAGAVSVRPKLEFSMESTRDPFESYIKTETPQPEPIETPRSEEDVPLPELTIQGLIWGGKIPCAIINNKVVRQGDSINNEIEVLKVSKEGVEVFYKGKRHLVTVLSRSNDTNKH